MAGDPIEKKITELYGEQPVVAAPGSYMGAPARGVAEYQISTTGAGLTKREEAARKALVSKSWATASPKIQEQAWTQAAAVSGGKGLPWSKSYTNYPGIALAAAKAINNGSVSREQLKTINAAVEIVDTATKLLSVPSDTLRQNMWDRIPETRKMAVSQAAFGMIDEFNALQAATMTQGGSQSPILLALGKAGSAAIDGLNWLSQQGQHAGRTMLRTWTTGNDPIQSWNDTAQNRFDPNAMNDLRTEYGDSVVNVVQDIVHAQQGDPEFTLDDVFAKYESDPQSLQVLAAVMFDSERSSVPNIEDILGRVNAARSDNLGGMVANMLTPDEAEGTSAAWTGISKGTNVFTLLTLDPTLAAGKAYRGYQAFRYGLMRAAGVGSLEKAFSNPATARFFSNVADDLVRYNDSVGSAAGKIAGEIKIKYGKYLTDDAINSLSRYIRVEGRSGVTDTGRLVQNWLNDYDGYQMLLNGQAARRPADRLIPRMTVAREARIKARLAGRDFIAFDGTHDSAINAIIGADLDAADIQAAKELHINPKTVSASRVAEMLQDPNVQAKLSQEFGLEPDSWARRILTFQPSQKTVRQRWDKLFHQFELIPRGLTISIDGPEDADKIYQFARTTFSKSLSETLRETWKFANTGERRRILNGMFDTIAQARGINLDEIMEDGVTTLRDKILTSGSKAMEQYAATVPGISAVPFGHPLESYSQRLTRAALPRLNTAARDRVNAINAKLSGFFEQQQSLRAQLSSLTDQRDALAALAETDKSIQTLIDQLDSIIASIKDDSGRAWGAGRALLKERKAIKELPEAFHYNPAEVNGKQHAIHLHQMANEIAVPDFSMLQQYQQRRGVLGKVIGGTLYSQPSSKIVDAWSAINLMAPRYVMRNAPEDWLGYFLSGGSLQMALKGRMTSTAYREIRGRSLGGFVTSERIPIIGGKRIGGIQELTRNIADDNALFGKWFLDHMPANDVRSFMDAIKNGDVDIAERIAGTAFARIQSSALGRVLDDIDEAGFKAFSTTDGASRLVDDVAELRGDLNNGRLVSVRDSGPAPQMRTDLSDLRQQKPGQYTDILFDHLDTDAYVAWHDMLTNILHKDERAGQIVFNAMRYADKYKGGLVSAGWAKYKERLVDFFADEEASSAWWGRSSMLQEIGPEEFARRYFDAASNYFAHEGVVNGKLIESLTRTSKDGAKFGAMYLKDAGRIADETRFGIDSLRQFGRFERPRYLLGKTMKTIGGTDDIGFMEKGFGYLGDSLARISREPLFFANYLDEWRAAQPQLIRMISEGMDKPAASKIIAEQAAERAEKMTVSYIDNPNVRTQLAFNARNVARYYRATEDFYRRVVRLGKYRPDEIQKLNLIYQNMNNSGFVWEDDQGVQYFLYPGTGAVNDAIAKALNVMGFTSQGVPNPFVLGGQTLMLTPSSDPTSMLPTFASPFSAPATKVLTAIGPFKWLEPVLLGSRGTKSTEGLGDLGSEVLFSVLPSPVLRLINSMDKRDRDTMFASTTISAIRYAAYAGVFDQARGESNDAFKRRAKGSIENIAWATLGLRFILGFMTPASPQIMSEDDLTEAARSLGVKNLRAGYQRLLGEYKGDYDRATAEWFKLNPDAMPFTIAGSEARGQGYPSMTSESGKWIIQNSEFVNRHPSATPFLTPDEGQFSFSTWNLAHSLRMIQGKSTDDAFIEAFTQRDYYVYMETKNDADAAIAAEVSPTVRNQYRERWAELKQQMYAENPFLEERVRTIKPQSNLKLKADALQDMRLALKDIYANRKNMVNDRTDKIQSMINTFDDGMNDIGRFGGSTDYATEMRKYNRTRLREILQDIAGSDRGSMDFYNRILDPMIG